MYEDLDLKLKKYARLEKDPLAVYLSKKLPEGAEKLEGNVSFCKMFDIVREKQKAVYASEKELYCRTPVHVFGMGEIDPAVRMGDAEFEGHGVSPSLRISRRKFSLRHVLEAGSADYVTVCLLEKAKSEPDVVVVQGKPANAQQLGNAYMNFIGRYPVGLMGSTLCSALVAAPYQTGEMTYILGEHYFGGPPYVLNCPKDEMFVAIPGELLKPIVEQLVSQKERVEKMVPKLKERELAQMKKAEQEATKTN